MQVHSERQWLLRIPLSQFVHVETLYAGHLRVVESSRFGSDIPLAGAKMYAGLLIIHLKYEKNSAPTNTFDRRRNNRSSIPCAGRLRAVERQP
jgi:hypothetical protein